MQTIRISYFIDSKMENHETIQINQVQVGNKQTSFVELFKAPTRLLGTEYESAVRKGKVHVVSLSCSFRPSVMPFPPLHS